MQKIMVKNVIVVVAAEDAAEEDDGDGDDDNNIPAKDVKRILYQKRNMKALFYFSHSY